MLTRGGICVPPTVTYLPYCVSGSTLTAVGRSQLLARWPGTLCRVSSGIQRASQTVLGVYLKRTCSRVTSASSALGVLNHYALYKSTHSLTPRGYATVRESQKCGGWRACILRHWSSMSCSSSRLASHSLVSSSNGLMKLEPFMVCVRTMWSSSSSWISSTAAKMNVPLSR